MRARIAVFFSLLVLVIAPACAQRIALFVPHSENFWAPFTRLARAAAQDLGVELTVHVSSRSPQRMLEQVQAETQAGVDGILFTDYQGIGEAILQQAEATGTPALLVNAALLNDKLVPRSHYRHWIGSVSPDDRQAGIRLTTHLLEAARRKGMTEFNILAFTGNSELPMIRRLEGLSSVVGGRSDVRLLQTVPYNDGEQRLIAAFDEALEKYPDINVVWAFADDHALLLARHYEQLGRKRPIVFGGINWTTPAMLGVRNGLIDVDLGGHLFDAAQGVVMMVDYLNGKDFGDQALTWQSSMVAATPENVDRFEYMLSVPERLDYKALSQTYNPDRKQLRFDLDAIAASARNELALSAEERQWIVDHPVVRASGATDWAPIDFLDSDGRYAGIANDYLQLIAQRTGLRFEMSTGNWSDILDELRSGQTDLVTAGYFVPDRSQYADFSPPFFETSPYFFIRDTLEVKDFDDLRRYRAAIPRGFAQAQFLKANFPDIEVVEADNVEAAIDTVLSGRADMLFDTHAVLTHTLRKRGIYSIIPFRPAPGTETHSIHMMTRKDAPTLGAIIGKALMSIGPEERNTIRRRWIDTRARPDAQGLLNLTPAERAWLDTHPQVRVEIGQFPPWEIVGNDTAPRGITIDLLRLAEQRLGIRFEITDALTWPDTETALKAHEVDMVGTLARTASREAYLGYTLPYSAFQYSVYTHQGAPPIDTLDDLAGRKVVIEEGFNTHELLATRYPDIDFMFASDTGAALRLLSAGKADAYIGNQGIANWEIEEQKLTNLRVAYLAGELGPTPLHFGVRKDWPEFQALMDKVIGSITDTEMLEIRRKWLGLGNQPTYLSLSTAEREWLKAHPVIRFAGDPNWLPYEARDADGRYVGIVADYLKIIEQQLGVRFQYVPTDTWTESVNLARERQVDVISETQGSDLSNTMRFSQAYATSPVVVIMRNEAGYLDEVSALGRQPVAVIRNYGYLPQVFARFPNLNYVMVDSIQEGLQAVATGRTRAMIASLAQASYHIGANGMNNLRIVGTTGVDVRLALAVQPDMAPLVPLLNRALASVPVAEKRSILDRWGRDRFAARIDYTQVAAVVAVAAVLLLLALLWIVTMRRQQRKLQRSEERFALAMEAANAGLWDYRIDTGDLYFSPLWMNMLGYEADELPHTMATFNDLIHPDDAARVAAVLGAMLQVPSSPVNTEFRLRAKDGSYRWVHSRGRVFQTDRDGNPVRALGTHLDITDRKNAEADLNLFRQFAETANIGFGMANMDTRIEYMNAALRRMLGIGSDEGQGDSFSRFYPAPIQRRLADEVVPSLEQDGTWSGELEQQRADGLRFPTFEHFFVVRDTEGRPLRLGDVVTDLSERRAAEAQFQRLIQALPIAVTIADLEGNIVLANPQAEREAGRGRSLVGINTREIYADPNMREKVIGLIAETGCVDAEEFSYITGDGEILSGLLSALPIQFNDQPAVLGVIVNITERRRMERELHLAKEEAEAANRFKGQFLANMSHEIRTPMNAIVGLGHLLNRTELSPQQQDYLGKIQVSARSLLTLIDDILDLSKIEAGQLRIETIDFDMGEVLDNIATLASTCLADKAVEFIYDIDPNVPPALRGDPHRLTQILTNLVGNATKFTERGGIVVRLHPIDGPGPIRLRFTVEDTGIGISPDVRERLFKPFSQADGSTTRLYGGTGLGLSICRQLCDLMGGSISVESEPGGGTSFHVELPFEASRTTYPGRNGVDAAQLRLLLVDDNAITRQVLADMLQSLAFKVEVVASGEAAVRRLSDATRPCDLVLLDWRMPGIDGLETARRIHGLTLESPPRIILMTAYGREAPPESPDTPALDGFLTKPITPSHLLDAVALALGPEHERSQRAASRQEHLEHRQLDGKVLLVEDNPINQQVARELLQQMGLTVSIAANGRQALEMVSILRPDLVLMDIQMPDMDGYQATAAIRALPGMGDLPIIAMTANAMAGDAERSLEAGMNGHVTKPVDPIRLFDTLLAWLPEGASVTSAAAAEPIEDDTAAADAPLDPADGVRRVGGNRALYARLCGDFAERYRNVVDELDTLCEAPDADALTRALHGLKGVAGNIGARATHRHAARLETLARTGALDAVRKALPTLCAALQASILEAERVAGREHPDTEAGGTDTSLADIVTLLRRLAPLVAAGDAEAVDLAPQLNGAGCPPALAAALRELRDALTDFDFARAQQCMLALQSRLDEEDTPP